MNINVPTTVFEVMTLLHAIEESDEPTKLNPSITVSQAKNIMIKGMKGRTEDFKNTSGDRLMLTNALAVIHNRKSRGIRTLVRKKLEDKP